MPSRSRRAPNSPAAPTTTRCCARGCARGWACRTSATRAPAAPARWSSSKEQVSSLRPDAPGLADRDRAEEPRARLPGAPAERLHHRGLRFATRTSRSTGRRYSPRHARRVTRDLHPRHARVHVPGARRRPASCPGQYALFYHAGARRAAHLFHVQHRRRQRPVAVRRAPRAERHRHRHARSTRSPIGAQITLDGPYGLAYLRARQPARPGAASAAARDSPRCCRLRAARSPSRGSRAARSTCSTARGRNETLPAPPSSRVARLRQPDHLHAGAVAPRGRSGRDVGWSEGASHEIALMISWASAARVRELLAGPPGWPRPSRRC